jgi:hypothetical protein
MILMGSQELIKSHDSRVASMALGAASGTALYFSTRTEEMSRQALLVLSGLTGVLSVGFHVKSNAHVRRAGLYFEASVTGVRITF